MNRSHVTLPQILVAASTRHASMVPESAGYLMLGLCEAIGCLPIGIADSTIQLSADGAVIVAEKGGVQPAPEAARAMRDLFARLLAVTTGATPRLAAVARPRDLSAEHGVDAFAAEVEAALVPMNRAAGKRSLGRLARETLRAIESGALALHLQARAAAKEAPAAAAAIAPLLAAPAPAPAPTILAAPPAPAPTIELAQEPAAEPSQSQRMTPTTPGLGLATMATEAPVDSSIFGATPTYKEGQDIAVEPNEMAAGVPTYESPVGFDSSNTKAISCEPTQLSARDVKIESAPRTPSSAPMTKAVSTKRRVRTAQTPKHSPDITLTSAGVEPRDDAATFTPAPSAPEGEIAAKRPALLNPALTDFHDCHDGNTQSQPKFDETLIGLAPIVKMAGGQDDAEPLQSGEYQLWTPSVLPNAVVQAAPTDVALEKPEEVELSSRLLQTAPPSIAMENASIDESPVAFKPLDNPSDPPGRVDELLGQFGRPEEGEEAMLRKTASSLKELAGLEPTPYAPEVTPAIRVPTMTKKATPAWLPEDRRQAAPLEPAPLVRASKGWRARLRVPFALFLALATGFAVVYFRLPEVMQRWISPASVKPATNAPVHATADDSDVYEQQ